jgi:thiamine-phosphate pyrophosphorylase
MLPRLYPILDVTSARKAHVAEMARALCTCRCNVLQLRAKGAAPQEILAFAAAINAAREAASPQGLKPLTLSSRNVEAEASAYPQGQPCKLILNDRPDLALLAGFDGCHLGQDDLSIGNENGGARKILPRPKILGLSTHNEAQVVAGDATDADYLAIGPVFATTSKADAAPALGLTEFVRLRRLTTKPVVAIGGVTRENARVVLDAGADSVAMIGDLYRGCTAENFAEQFAQNVRDILARIL